MSSCESSNNVIVNSEICAWTLYNVFIVFLYIRRLTQPLFKALNLKLVSLKYKPNSTDLSSV